MNFGPLHVFSFMPILDLCALAQHRLAQSTIQLLLPVALFPAPRFQFVLQKKKHGGTQKPIMLSCEIS